MEIKILGSVSPYCKGDKNCPGYLVISDNDKILLDCGNGITRNMILPDDLKNLTIIISHLHKDHYGDLLSLGYASYIYKNLGYINDKIKVYIPEADYYSCIERYNDGDIEIPRSVLKPIADYVFLNKFGNEHNFEFIPYKEIDELKIGKLDVSFSKNPHQINTFSTKIVDKNEVFVYSADTGFLGNSLVRLAYKADILLCEATFLRGQQRVGNNHLYAYEAALIARDAKVRQLVLTHLFPEIDRVLYVDEAKEAFENTECAIENKILKIGGINNG